MMKRDFIILLSFLSLLSGCEKSLTVPVDQLIERKDFVLTRADREIIQANNAFAFNLFRKVTAKTGEKSTMISPLSVTIGLGMVNNGAAGETQNEINRVLGYEPGSMEDLNAFCQSMLAQSAGVDPSTTIDLANAAVVNRTLIPLKDSFSKTIQEVYDAEVIYKEFGRDDVMGLINKWCSEKTRGQIPFLLQEQPKSSEYAHFLNAVYFKGIWSSKFKKSDTKRTVFKLEDGSETTVSMMWQRGKFNYGVMDNICEALCLPYGNQAYRMIILLPREDKTIGYVKNVLTSTKWSKLLEGMEGLEVDVKFPVFETTTNMRLQDVLFEMGIRQAFHGGDFHEMTDQPEVYINDVLHKAVIKVDETGSEAAAVTDVVYFVGAPLGGASFEPPVIEFHCDKPFLYAITEVSSGAIYFLGQYTGK